jgi:hypothetical protein
LDNAEAAPPTADVGGISSAVGMTTRRGMIMPCPPGWKIDLNAHVAAKALTRHGCRSRLYGASGYCFSQGSTPEERGTTFIARLPLNADRLDQNTGNTRAY